MTDLLPCPFCGNEGENHPDPSIQFVKQNEIICEHELYCIQCGNCGSKSSLSYDENEAIQEWNTRFNPESYEFRRGYMSAYARMMEILNIELWDNADLLNREVKTQSVKKEDIWKIPTLADYVCDKCNKEHYKCECEE